MAAFRCRILHDPELDCNFLRAASPAEQRRLRSTVMEMVLATDMKQHFALVAKLRTLITHARTTAASGVGPVSFCHHCAACQTALRNRPAWGHGSTFE